MPNEAAPGQEVAPGPVCARCREPLIHGCNTAFCSLVCEDEYELMHERAHAGISDDEACDRGEACPLNLPRWPRVIVEYHNADRARDTLSLAAAAAKFPEWGVLAFIREHGPVAIQKPGHKEVYSLRRYTESDCLRDAAPELLAACREALAWEAEDEFGSAVAEEHCTPAYRAHRDRLRAAIAKAEGRQ